MLQLEEFVFGATVRLSFDVSALPAGTSISGKLQRNGETYQMSNAVVDTTLTMSSPNNPLPAGKYSFVLLWYTVGTDEPIEEIESVLVIKPRK